jgi:hypothetical protein
MDIYLMLENQLAIMQVMVSDCPPHLKQILERQIRVTTERLESWDSKPVRHFGEVRH